MVLEGVDYSAHDYHTPAPWALLAAGKHFVVRYLADDWRGIDADEYQFLIGGGIEVAVVYEGTADRMLAGYNAGVADAQYAHAKLVRTGMPAAQPIYFACDVDATPEDQAAINAYLQGAASVIGLARVGVYGGYWVIKRAFEAGVAQWFWQTTAWSGGQLHPACHLYQYDYNIWIDAVNCDNTRAYAANYGQASAFLHPDPVPVPDPVPDPAPPVTPVKHETLLPLPDGMSWELVAREFGHAKDPTGKVFSFDKGRAACQVWFNRAVRSIPAGQAWDSEGSKWPKIEDIIRRGNGRWVYRFSDGSQYVSKPMPAPSPKE